MLTLADLESLTDSAVMRAARELGHDVRGHSPAELRQVLADAMAQGGRVGVATQRDGVQEQMHANVTPPATSTVTSTTSTVTVTTVAGFTTTTTTPSVVNNTSVLDNVINTSRRMLGQIFNQNSLGSDNTFTGATLN